MIIKACKQIKTALTLLILCSLITGLIYPSLVTAIAQQLFPWQANGSLIKQNGKVIGSALLGQYFKEPKYFWGRPSATSPYPYNSANSSGSNMGPSNPDFLATVRDRIELLRKEDKNKTNLIPVDLVTASGSGLDPDISPLAAMYQIPRISAARNIPDHELQTLVSKLIKPRSMQILGEPRINVLELNMALDKLRNDHEQRTS